MTVIAVALVIVALVAAVAYAGPKFYWYRLQAKLIHEQTAQEQERFMALKEAHDAAEAAGGIVPVKAVESLMDEHGQYL